MASTRPGAGARAQWRRRHLHAWPGAGASRGRAAVTCPQFSEHCPPVSGFAGCQVTRYPVPGNKNSRKQESWHGCVEEGPYRHTHTDGRTIVPREKKRPTHSSCCESACAPPRPLLLNPPPVPSRSHLYKFRHPTAQVALALRGARNKPFSLPTPPVIPRALPLLTNP